MKKKMTAFAVTLSVLTLCHTAGAQEVSDKCLKMGQLAGHIAAWRDKGVPERKLLHAIMPNIPAGDASKTVHGMIDDLYKASYAKNMTPDGAAQAFSLECVSSGN